MLLVVETLVTLVRPGYQNCVHGLGDATEWRNLQHSVTTKWIGE